MTLWPFSLYARIDGLRRQIKTLESRSKDQARVLRLYEARIRDYVAGPNGDIAPDVAWQRYHELVEGHVESIREGDPATDRDDKAAAMLWLMRAVFVYTWELKRC